MIGMLGAEFRQPVIYEARQLRRRIRAAQRLERRHRIGEHLPVIGEAVDQPQALIQ